MKTIRWWNWFGLRCLAHCCPCAIDDAGNVRCVSCGHISFNIRES